MGWQISHNEKGYQIVSTVSGKVIHEKKRLTEDETKSLMAEVALEDFFEALIKIDKDFLYRYSVNGVHNFDRREGEVGALKWMIDNGDKIEDEGQAILKKLLGIEMNLVEETEEEDSDTRI